MVNVTFNGVCAVLTGLSGTANVVCGLISTIMFVADVEWAEAMLCAYLCFFGILQLLSQRKDEAGKMKIGFVRSKFAFLHHDFGLGLYLLFVGSLGLGFASDLSSGIRYVLPFIAGCLTFAMALLAFLRICCGGAGGAGYQEVA
eukprot:Rhum_TRINITY_DN3906_c0_g1::Rhum_TRINITY_DN3906_c0_g1_i1::g.12402::m.12402